MGEREDPKNEGHTREWQDRARVVLDAKNAARSEASPNQSPLPDEKKTNNDENNGTDGGEDNNEKDDRFY